MKPLLSLGCDYAHEGLTIETIDWDTLRTIDVSAYEAIIVTGGDGSIRRCIQTMHERDAFLPIIVNAKGSFNVVAKWLRLPRIERTLDALAHGRHSFRSIPYYTLNEHVFVFSAGNMGDVQHIALAETLRFGWLRRGILKYLIALIALLPLHLIVTPLALLSKSRFFIFTPLPFLPKRLGAFRRELSEPLLIDLGDGYHLVELDGDIMLIQDNRVVLHPCGTIAFIQ